MQRCFLLLALFISTFTALSAQVKTLEVGRYTRQGTDVLVETGFLLAPTQGFSPLKSTTYPEVLMASQGLSSETLTQISGKIVVYKHVIDLLKQTYPSGYLDLYKFSKTVYKTPFFDSYTVTLATGTDTKAPTLTVKASKTALKEGPKVSATFNITLDKAPTSDIAVVFEFSGSVNGSDDYLSSHNIGSIKIKKGKKSTSVKITLRDDKLKEPKEKLVLRVKPHAGYKLGKKKSASITITDNDK